MVYSVLLLQRADTVINVTDLEGYRAFDLYNATINDTEPFDADFYPKELFTWGTNR